MRGIVYQKLSGVDALPIIFSYDVSSKTNDINTNVKKLWKYLFSGVINRYGITTDPFEW